MQAAQLTALREMELREVPPARLTRDTDVLLKVEVVGVCGSDVHYYLTGRIGSQVVSYPYRVGHEFSATVEAVGDAVRNVKPGDRVAVDPAMPCGTCDQCLLGRAHTCRALRFLGCPGQADGCLCEAIVMPGASCFPVGPATTLELAAVVEPLSIGVYATRLAAMHEALAIGILGCGPIGMSVLLAAKAAGGRRIYVTDKIEARAAMAARQGAAWTGRPDQTDVAGEILRREPAGLDAVFECCGEQEALDQAVALLKPGGTLLMIGIPTVDRVSFAIDPLRRKELRIQNVRRQNECMQATLDLVESGKMDPGCMITHRFPLAQATQAFELVAGYRDGVMKAMIEVGKETA